MAQVSLYIDDSLLKRLEQRARSENLSVSAWVRAQLEESLAKGWSAEFLATFGSLADLENFERPVQPGFELDSTREPFGD